jgi:cysteine desulfurase
MMDASNRSKMEVYLDHSATTPVCSEALDAMTIMLKENYGNPSSLHRMGLEAEKAIKAASQTFLAKLRAGQSQGEIIFTSGGTEANNLAISGAAAVIRPSRHHIVTSQTEHSSVLETVLEWEKRGYEVTVIKSDASGVIRHEAVLEAVRPDTGLISLMHVNNETGAIFDLSVNLKAALRHLPEPPLFHVDAVQSFGKLPIDVRAAGIDLLTASAHKIHGPKGIGFLYKDKSVRLKPLVFGGGQQGGIRPGTENVAGIIGMEAALKALTVSLETSAVKALRARLIQGLSSQENVVFNSPSETDCAPHILNVSFLGLKSEVMLHTLEKEGIYVSSGSACHSKDRKSSHVLTAMGLSPKRIDSALRLSLSVHTTEEEIDYAIETVCRVNASLGLIMRRK